MSKVIDVSDVNEARVPLLLATDLSARCDRATARAIRLAEAFGGAAVAATVVAPEDLVSREVLRPRTPAWYRPVAPLARAREQLQREFAAAPAWSVRIGERGSAGYIAQQLDALGEQALVVAGPMREGVFGARMLGSTLDVLLRRPRLALLVVREQAHADYRRILVASDFSVPSRQALLRARGLFPQAQLTVLHGFSMPMPGIMDGLDDAIEQSAVAARERGAAFLRECGLADGEASLLVEYGDPARLVRQYLETHGDCLVVAGTHGHGAMYELVVGSVARRIATAGDGDVLLVRG